MSLVEKTVTASNGAITVKDALTKMKQKIRKRKEDVENEYEIFFSRKRFYVVVAVLVIGLILGGCAGSSKKKAQPPEEPVTEQKGSLSRTFTIVDEQGRNAGTLSLDFSGGAVLRDENGKIIGNFKPVESSEAQPSEVPSKPEATEIQSEPEKSEAQSKPEAAETQSEPQPSETQSETETSEPDTKVKE
jgi:hypothetical protein